VLTFWAIVAGGTLDDYAKLAGKRRQIVAAMFDFALAIIEEHYGSDATP
jgi:hypothetical protein